MNGQRISYRRSVIALTDGTRIRPNLSGELAVQLSKLFAPKPPEIQAMLLDLRQRLVLSRASLAGLLGVSVVVVRKWEKGNRVPNAAGRKLIWLVHRLFIPQATKLESSWDITYWGK